MKQYETIADLLRRQTDRLPCGARLPSMRSLMKRYKCSLFSVNAALRVLESEELIETRRGSGTYVSLRKGMRHIELHRLQEPSAAIDTKEASLRTAILAEGWKLTIRRHNPNLEDHGESPAGTVSARILTPDLFHPSIELFNRFLREPVPVLALGREADSFHIDSVTGNDHQILSLVSKHLRGLGHSRLAMLVNEPDYFEIAQRRDLFSEILAMFDMPPPVFVECSTVIGENSAIAAHRGLSKFLAECHHKIPFTALITASASGVIGALRALHEAAIQVPKACSLVTFGLSPENFLRVPAITEAGMEDTAWGNGVLQVLRRRFENPQLPPISIKLAAHLFERESTAPPSC